MIDHSTGCKWCTRVPHSTGIDAVGVLACSIVRAVIIARASNFQWLGWRWSWEGNKHIDMLMHKKSWDVTDRHALTCLATNIGVVAEVVGKTLTLCNMVLCNTDGIQSTSLETACILTASLMTDLGVVTFVVHSALGLYLHCKKMIFVYLRTTI